MKNTSVDRATKPSTAQRHIGLITGLCLSLAVGGFAGYIDFHNNEPQPAVIVIAVGGLMTGFLSPRNAWMWAILIGCCLPAAYCIGYALGYEPVGWPEPGWYASLLALVPSFLAVYCGVYVRQALIYHRLTSNAGDSPVPKSGENGGK